MVKQCHGTQIIQCTLSRQKPVKAAVIVFGNELQVIHDPQLVTENVAAVLVKAGNMKLGVLSVYFEGDQELSPYLERTRSVCLKLGTNNLLVAGDVNAWSLWWGSVSGNHRGEEYNTFLNEMDLQILNTGQTPTFETYRGDKLCTSIVDVTACSLSLLGKIEDWKVNRSLTTSDHNAITFSVQLEKALEPLKPISTRIYNTRKAKWSDFKTEFSARLAEANITLQRTIEVSNPQELEDLLTAYTDIIHKSCANTIPKVGQRKGDPRPPWWNSELEQQKREVLRFKRRIKNACQTRRSYVIQDYIEAKEKYQLMAAEASTQNWKDLCTTQERESMWDGIYRVIRQTGKRHDDMLLRNSNGETLSPEQSAHLLAKTFYPDDSMDTDLEHHKEVRRLTDEKTLEELHLSEDDPLFTDTELEAVLRNLNPKKAPGPDGLTSDICTASIVCSRETFLAMANKCLVLSHFPKQWKIAHVCIIRKPGKEDYTQPKSYRPIGLLSVLGKIVEKLLVGRLQFHIFPTLHPNQYGFMPQRGTEDALYILIQHIQQEVRAKKVVLLVSLDIEGAFDNAWWPALKQRLVQRCCPKNIYALVDSYLKDRKVKVNYARASSEKGTTKGCVQGSIGGPTFWNLILDTLLHKMANQGVYCQAFADDVVLVFSDRDVSTLQQTAETTLATVHEWGVQNKLSFAAHKTNAMVVTKKLKYDSPVIHMCGARLKLVNEIKLLGLTIDRKLTFNAHVSAICKRAADIYKVLARAAKVSWGLNREIIRTIYVSVIEPIVLYAASAWSPAAEKLMVRKQLDSLQRGFAQKVCKAYRTVSLTSALTLSSLLPLDLRIHEAAILFKIKKGYSEDYLPPGREVEGKISFLENIHPSQLTTTEYECLDDLNPETLTNHQIVGPQIYTDGSKIEGKVGAALTWWNSDRESRYSTFRLERHNTVFQSELYALFRAVKMVKQSKERFVNILSDSRSSLDLLRSPIVTHPLAFEIKKHVREIREQGRDVRLFWLRAHVGTAGNERADELAKKAALTKKTAPDYDKVPISFVRKQIREETVSKWQQRYESSSTGSVTKAFFPTVSFARRVLRETCLTPTHVQMLTGHGGFAAYLHRFHIKDSPSCICDPVCEENVWHVLFECPRFGLQRMELEIQIQLELKQEHLPTIMEDQTKRTLFLAFGSKAVLISGKRNGAFPIRDTTPHAIPHTTRATFRTNTAPFTNTYTATTSTNTTAITTATTTTTTSAATAVSTNTAIVTTTTTATTNAMTIATITATTTAFNITNTEDSYDDNKTQTEAPDSYSRYTDQIRQFLAYGEASPPGIRVRGIALFMDNDKEKLGVSFCRVGTQNQVAISPGLASLLHGSTAKMCIKRKTFDALPTSKVAGCSFRIVRSRNKVIALFEWRAETPFAQACTLLTKLKEAANITPRVISVDAMAVELKRGRVADRYGCLIASEHHEIVVYEDRGEDLSFLKVPKHDVKASASLSSSTTSRSGSEILQLRQTAKQSETRSNFAEKIKSAGRLRAVAGFVAKLAPALVTGIDRQAAAVADFLRKPSGYIRQPPSVRTRADKGQVVPPSLVPVSEPLDCMINAFLEFQAIIRATREVNRAICENILQAFRHGNNALLKVRLEEAVAAIYNNDTAEVIIGDMSGQYMAAYSASCGFVRLEESETERTGHLRFHVPENDPIVVTAKCTRIMLDDGILRTAETVCENPVSKTAWLDWELPDIRWINGVPGCGKTTAIIAEFDEDRDIIITTTIEAAKDLRAKLANRLGSQAQYRIRTMASVLANGFREPGKYSRLTVDEALMNHFGAVVMAARLSNVTELVLVGDTNQLPYFDRVNLFEIRYSRPDLVTSIGQELFCTFRSPMDVAFALQDVYTGMYSSRPRVRSLKLERYTNANIPKNLPDTLYLFHTQEEKEVHARQGYGEGLRSRVLTIHEAQGLTSKSVIVIQSMSRRLRLHDSVPHAVVALSRHTNTCVYYADDRDDAIGRLMWRAERAFDEDIKDHNLKMAMRNRDMGVIETMLNFNVEPTAGAAVLYNLE